MANMQLLNFRPIALLNHSALPGKGIVCQRDKYEDILCCSIDPGACLFMQVMDWWGVSDR